MAVVDRNILRAGDLRAALGDRRAAQGRDQRGARGRQEVQHAGVEPLHQRDPRPHPQRAGARLLTGTAAHPLRGHLRRPRQSRSPHRRARRRGRRRRARACSAWAIWSATAPTRWPAWRRWASGPARWWRATTSTARSGCWTCAGSTPAARAAALWTREQLDDGHRGFLTGLPADPDDGGRHARAREPAQPGGVGLSRLRGGRPRRCSATSTRGSASSATRTCPASGRWASGGPDHSGRLDRPEAQVRLDDGRRYLINVGSVGQPRDRDPRACYAIWDREAPRGDDPARRLRSPRPRPAKILAAGLPRALADRLAHGS